MNIAITLAAKINEIQADSRLGAYPRPESAE